MVTHGSGRGDARGSPWLAGANDTEGLLDVELRRQANAPGF